MQKVALGRPFVDKFGFMGEILCSFLARVGKKRTKETPLKDWGDLKIRY